MFGSPKQVFVAHVKMLKKRRWNTTNVSIEEFAVPGGVFKTPSIAKSQNPKNSGRFIS